MQKRNADLRRQAKEIIYSVYRFMEKEIEDGVIDPNKVHWRVANATGVSQRTIQRITNEGINSGLVSLIRTPGKKRPRVRPITDINNFDQGVIKRFVHNFHNIESEMPTVEKLLVKVKCEMNFRGSNSSLKTIISNLGFKWRRLEANKRIPIEKTDIRLKRITYLQALKKYRDEGRPIVFTGETYVQSSCTKAMPRTDGFDNRLKQPISNYQRIFMAHAGSEEGFVPNALFIFKSDTSENHKEMNFPNYEQWLQTQVIPNLKPNSVVVVGNAPYHNKLMNPVPTPNSKKTTMETYLIEKGVPYETEMLKPQLYELIKSSKDQCERYVIEEGFKVHNYEVLRLPPCHPDLNPIDIAWATIKYKITNTNVNRNVNWTKELIQDKFHLMEKEEWGALYRRVMEAEEEYRKSDRIIDEMTDRFMISTESDSESDSDDFDEPLPSTSHNMQCSVPDEFTLGDSSLCDSKLL